MAMSKEGVTIWVGNVSECQLCSSDFDGVMYDVRIPSSHIWGNLCQECFTDLNCSLGTGLGQKYHLREDGKWEKVGG